MGRGRVRHTIVLFILFSLSSLAWAQIIHIPAQTPEQGKAFSEFNHRMTGVFLMATGSWLRPALHRRHSIVRASRRAG